MSRSLVFAGVALVSFGGLAGGCAQLTSVRASDGEIAGEAQRFAAPTDWVYDRSADGAIASDWSAIIEDDMLDALIVEALENNRSLAASAENIARSEALLRQSRAGFLPALTGRFGASATEPLGGAGSGSESYSAAVQASWEADLWGRVRAGALVARYDLVSTQALHESARQSLAANVARAYIASIETRLQLDLAVSTEGALEETLRIVRARYDRGSASRREVVLAEADLASARATRAQAGVNARAAARGLEALLGRYTDGSLQAPDAFPLVAETVMAGQPADVLRRRPDVVSAEFDVRAAFANVDATRASRWPSLTLSADVSSAALDLGDVFDTGSASASFGAALATALFDGGLTRGRIEAAEAGGRQALAAYGQTVLDAFSEVEGRLDDVATLGLRREQLELAADASRETLRLAQIQYEEGALDLLDVLTFQQRSFSADQGVLSVRRAEIEARIALYLALGGAQVPLGD